MARRLLSCWWDDTHVADFQYVKPWELRCQYTKEALDRWPTNTRLLSCSLPVQSRPQPATPFVRGVLPEGAHLQALAQHAGLAVNDLFGLLGRYGRDVAGALVFADGRLPPDRGSWAVEPYSTQSLAAEVVELEEGLAIRDDSELSLAGIQNKFLLVDLGDGAWGRPIHGRPSTHILKVDSDRYDGLVALEGQCLALAQALGLTTVNPVVTEIGGRTCLIVERYDRVGTDEHVRRLHQEDSCQALGIDTEASNRRAKYEEYGGPTLRGIAGLLSEHSREPEAQLDQLVRYVTFTHLIRNADAHGKNVSFIHDLDGMIELAPLYDTVPTVLWPNLRSTAAMTVSGRNRFDRIGVDEVGTEARTWGMPIDRAVAVAAELVEKAVAMTPEVVSDGALQQLIGESADRFLNGPTDAN